jgi:hypothetical protein
MGLSVRKRTHTLTVEPYVGNGAHGPVFGPAVAVTGFLDQTERLVRASNGTEVVASSTFFCDLDTNIPVESRVTLPDGKVHSVVQLGTFDTAGRSRLEHKEAALA